MRRKPEPRKARCVKNLRPKRKKSAHSFPFLIFFCDINSAAMIDDLEKFDADDFLSSVCEDPASLAALENFGIKYLFPWQRLVVANIMDSYYSVKNRDENSEILDCAGKQIVLLPTGAGKSLCFQIPAILMDGPTLVIYPLLALMSDQQRRMEAGGIKAAFFRGGQSNEEREKNFKLLDEGAKIIIANPEILMNENLTERLKKYKISHIAIDEAHCVSEWGDSFRPAYLELGKILKKLDVPVTTAFTATASPEVLARISDVLFEGKAHIVRSESDRPNIHYYVKKVASKKAAALVLAKTEARPMIIFCGTRSRTEDMAQELNTAFGAETAKFYHAGMEREEKTKIEEWFFNQKDAVLCATCAYGMGVDKKDIHTVVHLDSPQTAEAYIQEAGRGGRDGSVANAILLWNFEDSLKFSEFQPGTRKAALKDFAETNDCRRQVLLDALGAEKAVCSGCDNCRKKELENKIFERKKKYFYAMKKVPFGKKIAETAEKIIEFQEISGAHLQEQKMPGGNIPNDEEIAFRLIELCRKYFTREKFEKFYIKYINQLTIPFTSVNIWNHESFCAVFESLLSRKKIEICRWPWRGMLKIKGKNKKYGNKFLRYAKLKIFVFRRKLFLQARKIGKNFRKRRPALLARKP